MAKHVFFSMKYLVLMGNGQRSIRALASGLWRLRAVQCPMCVDSLIWPWYRAATSDTRREPQKGEGIWWREGSFSF